MSFPRRKHRIQSVVSVLGLALLQVSGVASARLLGLDDMQREMRVGFQPEISPDGRWVAYVVTGFNDQTQKQESQLWKVSWDGKQQVQLTQGPYGVSEVRWSPEGKYLSFLSARFGDDAVSQVWAFDSQGGDARALTDVKDGVAAYAWSPDGARLALVIRPKRPKPEPLAKAKPLVIQRYQFKSDGGRYHDVEGRPARIHLYEIASKQFAALTAGEEGFEESDPSWSPDGRRIAFVSNRDAHWERTDNTDIWLVDAKPGATVRRLTTYPGKDAGPISWSRDGQQLAYMQGQTEKYRLYGQQQVAVISVAGGEALLPTQALDQYSFSPRFSEDGRSLDFLFMDSRVMHLGRVPAKTGVVQRVIAGNRFVGGFSTAKGRTVVSVVSSNQPTELYAWEQGKLRALTEHSAVWLSDVQLAQTRGFEFTAADGASVHGLLTLPPNAQPGERLPLILWIHGGPYNQDYYFFEMRTQLFAAHGYAVAAINYRGSAGRGTEFARGIFADWGNKDRTDLMAGVDYLIQQGIADPQRLGVGGWSQGGILTNYVIAKDTRFKAAISGAGAGSQMPLYGSDEYVMQYDHEFQPPWVNPQRWLDLSYPLFHANQIKTPTLYMGGLQDFNVPIIGGEQMYQALQSLSVPTQLVIYPEERHAISAPAALRDRMERYLAWYDQYLR